MAEGHSSAKASEGILKGAKGPLEPALLLPFLQEQKRKGPRAARARRRNKRKVQRNVNRVKSFLEKAPGRPQKTTHRTWKDQKREIKKPKGAFCLPLWAFLETVLPQPSFMDVKSKKQSGL